MQTSVRQANTVTLVRRLHSLSASSFRRFGRLKKNCRFLFYFFLLNFFFFLCSAVLFISVVFFCISEITCFRDTSLSASRSTPLGSSLMMHLSMFARWTVLPASLELSTLYLRTYHSQRRVAARSPRYRSCIGRWRRRRALHRYVFCVYSNRYTQFSHLLVAGSTCQQLVLVIFVHTFHAVTHENCSS